MTSRRGPAQQPRRGPRRWPDRRVGRHRRGDAPSHQRVRRPARRARPGGGRRPCRRTGAGSFRIIHRPGSVQTEIRVGHPGLPRRIPDFHAVSVMGAILGGLFNSRLNMRLREEKGYTYGAGAGFDLRRGAGPFAARAAVNTEVTVPAVVEMLAELERMRDEPVTHEEVTAARDYLIGVFPLRFETAGAVGGALGSLVVHGLTVQELIDYRARHRGGRHRRDHEGGSRPPPHRRCGDRARRRCRRVRRRAGGRGARAHRDRARRRRGCLAGARRHGRRGGRPRAGRRRDGRRPDDRRRDAAGRWGWGRGGGRAGIAGEVGPA